MMTGQSGQCFRVNSPLVATQTIEGETILIHFETGCYYSANATGSAVFALIEEGRSFGSIVAHLVNEYQADQEEARGAVERFLSLAEEEGLVVTLSSASSESTPNAPFPVRMGGEGSFLHPSLEKFEDLQDLLLLDPIHDVDQAGWPVAPPDQATEPASAEQR